jgi:hypothetical protein
MDELDTLRRINAVNDEARRLGYRIYEEVTTPNQRPIYTAFAEPIGDAVEPGRLLCRASSALVALEDGLEILRRAVVADDSWPDPRD